MNHALVIASREVREKGRLFTLSLVLAVLPFAATLVPTLRGWGSPTIIGMFGGMLAIAMGLGLAIALGSTVVMRELTERRMSFYFSKPLSPLAIWIGKAAGGIFTAFACFTIIALPSLVSSRKIWDAAWNISQAELFLFAAVAVVVMFVISHALSSMVRSRSALLGLDLALLIGSGFALLSMARPLLQGQAVQMVGRIAMFVAIALTLILLAAPVWQLARGRADVRRSHAALSRFVWSAVAVLLLATAGFVAWVVTPSASDIVRGTIQQAPGGQWLMAYGTTKNRGDYVASMLIDARSGSEVRIPTPWSGPVFSRDGRTAIAGIAQAVLPKGEKDVTLNVLQLGDGERPRLRDTGIPAGFFFVPSDDGTRVATIDRGTVTVHDLTRDALLASAAGLPERGAKALLFVTPNLLRIWHYADPRTKRVSIYELDVARKSLTKTGEVDADLRYRGLVSNVDGSRVLLENGLLIDGRTGAALRKLPVAYRLGGAILSDGTVVMADAPNGKLHLFDRDGNPLRQVSIPRGRYARFSTEVDGGRLVLSTVTDPGAFTTLVVDTARGVVERELPAHEASQAWYTVDPRLPRMRGDAALATYDKDEGFMLWDPRSGARKAL